MAVLAVLTSCLEMVTTGVIVLFAQVLNQPEIGRGYLSNIGLETAGLSSGRLVFYMAFAIGVVYVIKNGVATAEGFYQHFTIQKMSHVFKRKILNRYIRMNYGYYLTRNSSSYIQVFTVDIEQTFAGMTYLANLISESIICFFLVSFIIFMNPSLALVIFSITGLLGFTVSKGLLPRSYRWGQHLQEASLRGTQHLVQFFHAFKEMVLRNNSSAFIKAYQEHSLRKSRIQALQASVGILPRLIIEVLFVGLFIIAIAFLCLEQESPIHMIGILAGYLYVGFRLMPGFNRIIAQLNAFKAIIPSIERVYQEWTMLSITENYVDQPAFSFKKSLTLSGVSFSYLNTTRKALSDITFEIKKGESLGIVGETGSGKSTLVDVMLGLLHPQEGSVLIDHHCPVNTPQWHRRIGYVPQAIYLLDDTIEANIVFGEQKSDAARLAEVIHIAQLSAFVARLPNGVQTIVGERGVRLSGGERQRIAIARALYHHPDVLIFDEATSSLDQATEVHVMEAIRLARQHRTVIMIAHRLTTLKDCDRIVVMAEGKIQKITDYAALCGHKRTC